MKGLYALVGMKHRGTEAFVASLPAGEPLKLIREAGNGFDPNAVQVWAREQHVGYIAAKQVKPVAIALDRKMAEDKRDGIIEAFWHPAVLRVKPGRWPMVEVE